MKILTAKEKIASALQILDALKKGEGDENESLEALAQLGENELNSDAGQILRDGLSIARSLAARAIGERQSEPLLVHALSGIRTRSKPFLSEPEPAE